MIRVLLVLAILLVLLEVGISTPVIRNWSLAEVAEAESNPDIAPDELKSLVEQIKEGVFPSFIDNHLLKSPSGNDKWTVEELENAISKLDLEDPNKFPEYRNALKMAHLFALWNERTSVYVRSPKQWIQTWTMADLNEYMDNSEFPNALFAEQVKEHREMLKEAIANGKNWSTISMITVPDYYYDAGSSNEHYEE